MKSVSAQPGSAQAAQAAQPQTGAQTGAQAVAQTAARGQAREAATQEMRPVPEVARDMKRRGPAEALSGPQVDAEPVATVACAPVTAVAPPRVAV